MYKRENLLFVILGGFFIANALLAEFIGVKIFSLEESFGFSPINLNLFGQGGLSFNLTAGVIIWPVVFIMTDIINEYYGKKGVRILTNLTVALIIYAYIMVTLSIEAVPADFWMEVNDDIAPDINTAFQRIFGQGLWIIIGSLVAFLIGQIVDVTVFHYLRRFTGSSKIWVRATGSTLVSQLIDSFVVLFIAFYVGPPAELKWAIPQLLAVGTVNYIYKFVVAVALTPLLYLLHWAIDRYLGKEVADKMIAEAALQST